MQAVCVCVGACVRIWWAAGVFLVRACCERNEEDLADGGLLGRVVVVSVFQRGMM